MGRVYRWFLHPQVQFNGQGPREALGNDGSPEGSGFQRIRALTEGDLHFQAT